MLQTNPIYVFDSGPFIDLKNYPRDIFPSIWSKFEGMLSTGHIISSMEVCRELINYDDEIADWAYGNKHYFHKPTLAEQRIAARILTDHPEIIKQAKILSGKPAADPFIIAQAKDRNCTLVQREKNKPNAHNIPMVCAKLQIPNISLFDFFRKEGISL